MGTWSEKIKDNDATLDIYTNFFERYNAGENPTSVSKEIRSEFQEYFSDSDDRNNSLIGLALAQWETKSLEPELLQNIVDLVSTGDDLRLWKELGADDKSLKKRQKELEKFLTLISTERPKARRRVRPKIEFTTNEILRTISPDNKKELVVQDEYSNGEYIHTSGIMSWFSGGGAGIFYHNKANSKLFAKWINNQNIVLTHEPRLNFSKKENKVFFSGDEVHFNYREG
jgi:hypothetical protein